MDQRTSSAMFKRAEQLKRWEASDTNNQSTTPKRASRIQFSPGIIFLAACTSGDKDEVKRLLKLGADINTANIDGITALHEACIEDNFDMVQFLVENGADVNRADNEGWTPLHATANCGFVSIARYLLENGADVAAVNYDGELPVDIVGSDEMEQLLQKAIDETGIDCERSRNAEVTTLRNDALNWATNGYVEVRDPKTGGTPLHVAAAKGYVDVAKTLLEDCNAEPDAMDYEGWTPLHAAALWGQKETAAMLLHYGADPSLKNFSGQTCMDLVDQSVSAWLSDAIVRATRCANNNKRKISPPKHEVKRAEPKTTADTDNIVNEKSPAAPEIIKKAEVKPPKGRAPSPGNEAQNENSTGDEGPSWRRSASFKSKQQENNRENKTNNNNMDTDTILRRTHSFENDKTFYQRYRDVTARIKATSCPSILPPPPQITLSSPENKKQNKETNNVVETNDDVQTRVTTAEKRENKANTWNTISNTSANTNTTTTNSQTTVRSGSESVESNSSNSTPSSATPTKLSPGNIFKNFFKSFVPPVRDEESETQRKAHAKRVRETRRSTQGVTLDEIKSAEQLVKKKTNNGTTETIPPASPKKSDENHTENSTARSTLSGGDAAFSLALACVTATATATIAANSERRPSWRLRLDPTNKFELEDVAAPRSTTETEATVTLPLRRPPSGANQNTPSVTSKDSPPVKENSRTVTQDQNTEEEKDRESSCERKSSITSPASTQAALNVIQRRRRPKRRSTGVGHVDMDDIVNDRRESGEVDCDSESVQSGSERTEEVEEKDYKALYEASQIEVQRQRAMLATTEQQLREARATITRLTQVNQNSLSDIEKREKRAMERKLSEMEEELKQFQKLKAENERLRAENRALTRVVSKLTNSVAK
ncbi:protein phosphatase 1 regulatory subunit 12B isoform X2 [Leptidea sinapis]|uniref:protein phosphatase 1 regulatory subunit 12B isoform X2 n=1 Tax=Leptidea sinapis TaxID=189913 RepID=UPI0021C33204|nr:protein phosphatase 1 regulatory subunit 12B isoform X2 [Leptidea sinapis]